MKRILVVDDQVSPRAGMARLLTAILNERGLEHEVVQCENATQAREAMAVGAFDLVISDQNMHKDGTGVDLLTELRAAGNPVTFVLHCSDPEEVAEEVTSRGGHMIKKPMTNPTYLLSIMQKVFNF